jgi:hypothetical protein
MQHDIEATFHRPLPDFIRVVPEGFQFANHVQPELKVSIQDEQVVRKLWDRGRVLCQSLDGTSSLATRKACRICKDQRRCTSRLILYILADDAPFRLPLNFTSAQNYFAFRRQMLDAGHELSHIITALSVQSHQTWGEVQFQQLF